MASDGWTGSRSRSAFTYAQSVLLAARSVGIEAEPYAQPTSYGARIGGFIAPFLRSALGGYSVEDEVVVHQATHGARRGVDVATVFDLYAFRETGGLPGRFRRSAVRASLRRAKRVVALTESGAREIGRAFPEYRDKLRAAPMAFEAIAAPRGEELYDALWVGVWDDRKNPRAYLSLAARFPEQKFAMRVERSALPESTGNLVPLHDLSEAALDQLYRSVRVLVVTSTVEGFHAPSMEAYLRGAQLLLPRIEPFTEIYGRDDGNVFWFDPTRGPEEMGTAFRSAMDARPREPHPDVVRSVSYRSVGERLRGIYEEVRSR